MIVLVVFAYSAILVGNLAICCQRLDLEPVDALRRKEHTRVQGVFSYK